MDREEEKIEEVWNKIMGTERLCNSCGKAFYCDWGCQNNKKNQNLTNCFCPICYMERLGYADENRRKCGILLSYLRKHRSTFEGKIGSRWNNVLGW